jgi:hypothetical protein
MSQVAHKRPAPFVSKLWKILLEQELSGSTLCEWDSTGATFTISSPASFASLILPKYFSHAKYASFQRQLNYFAFAKVGKSASHLDQPCCYEHPLFRRGHPDNLVKIVRKTNHRRLRGLKRKPAPVVEKECTSGYLLIQNYKAWGGWSKRYFQLQSGAMKYFKSNKSLAAAEGQCLLSAQTKCYMQEGVQDPCIFYIMNEGRTMVLRSTSQREMMQWLQALKEEISHIRAEEERTPSKTEGSSATTTTNSSEFDDAAVEAAIEHQWQWKPDDLQLLMAIDREDAESVDGEAEGECAIDSKGECAIDSKGDPEQKSRTQKEEGDIGETDSKAPKTDSLFTFDTMHTLEVLSILSDGGLDEAALCHMEKDTCTSQASSDGLSGLSDMLTDIDIQSDEKEISRRGSFSSVEEAMAISIVRQAGVSQDATAKVGEATAKAGDATAKVGELTVRQVENIPHWQDNDGDSRKNFWGRWGGGVKKSGSKWHKRKHRRRSSSAVGGDPTGNEQGMQLDLRAQLYIKTEDTKVTVNPAMSAMALPIHASECLAETLQLQSATPKRRGEYMCGRCGQKKNGHICTQSANKAMVRSVFTQCDLRLTAGA